MATAKPIASTPTHRPVRRRAVRVGLLLAALAIVLLAWFWRPLGSYAVAGASYGARIGCSCRYVEGRSLADCRKDIAAPLVTLNEDDKAKSVTARFPLLARQTATYQPGQGCLLQKWTD